MSVRSAIALVAAPLACLAVAGCGGGAAGSSDAPVAIPHQLGLQLVGRTSAVEASLSSGDQCTALHQASGLQQAEQDAIAAGRIPAELQAPLVDSTQALIDQIHCAPAPPKPPKPHHHDDHNKKHGGEGD
jgi:hypothetical protein